MLFFEVRELPDLTLNKYSALGDSGVEGVLDAHRAYLRQIYRLGRELRGTFRWYYQYDPVLPRGSRMRIGLSWDFERDLDQDRATQIISASALGQFFRFIPVGAAPKTAIGLDFSAKYALRANLTKKEKTSVSDGPNQNTYYSVNRWEMNQAGRLFSMFSLMREMNAPSLYCVTIKPLDLADEIEKPERLGKSLAFLRRVLALRMDKAVGGGVTLSRDEAADYTLKRYQELIEDVSASPHFATNITAYANEPIIAAALLDAAAAESVTKGTHTLSFEKGPWSGKQMFSGAMSAGASQAAPAELRFWPNLFLLDEVDPFVRLPALFDGEAVEMRKETAPSRASSGLTLGIDRSDLPIDFPLASFPKHTFICGVPGSGKTNTMMHLASTLHVDHQVPILIIEPAKREYRAMFNQPEMADVILFSPSASTRFPLHINPFEFPAGVPLAEHIRALDDVFAGAFHMENPAPFIVDACIEDVYRARGWHPKMSNTGRLPFPTMRDLYDRFEQRVADMEYSDEIKGNMKSFLQVRFGSLLTREMGDIFDVPASSLAPEEWLTRSVIIETESMGSEPANFLSLLLTTLIRETLKANPLLAGDDRSKPRHVIFYEEAHNLIGPVAEASGENSANPKSVATAFIVKMLAEVRALNEAIVIADQLPSALAPEVIKNTSLKIAHRLVDQEERGVICGAMSADSVQFERMATFVTGQSLVSYEGLLRPFETRLTQWATGKVSTQAPSDEQLLRKMIAAKSPTLAMMVRSGDITLAKYQKQCEALLAHLETIAKTASDYGMELAQTEKRLKLVLRALAVLEKEEETARGELKLAAETPTAVRSSLDDLVSDLMRRRREFNQQREACVKFGEALRAEFSNLNTHLGKAVGELSGLWLDIALYAEQNRVRRSDVSHFLADRQAKAKARLQDCVAAGLAIEQPAPDAGIN